MKRQRQKELDKILGRAVKRQLARFLTHLKDSGQLTPALEKSVKRSFGFLQTDLIKAIRQGKDEEE